MSSQGVALPGGVGDPASTRPGSQGNLLCVLLDCHPGVWSHPPYSVKHFLYTCEQLIMFINAYLLLEANNSVCVIAALPQQRLVPSPSFLRGCGFIIIIITFDASSVLWTSRASPLPLKSDSQFIFPVPRGNSGTRGILEREQQQQQMHAEMQEEAGSSASSDSLGFSQLTQVLVKNFKLLGEALFEESSSDPSIAAGDPNRPTLLAGALSLALCYSNRKTRAAAAAGGRLDSRILIVCPEIDSASQFVPSMNAMFSAQKRGIPIDVFLLNPTNTASGQEESGGKQEGTKNGRGSGVSMSSSSSSSTLLLEQAADLTGGLFWTLDEWKWLGQWLMNLFLPDGRSRNLLVLPRRPQGSSGGGGGASVHGVDYRATCFCHRRVVDMGFVCPVCLAIYCQSSPECPTCRSRFALPISKRRRRSSKASTTKQDQDRGVS